LHDWAVGAEQARIRRIDCTSFSTALVEYAAEQASSAAFASSAGPTAAEPSGGCHGHIQSEG